MSESKDFTKLCILNAEENISDEQIRSLCAEFGGLVGFNRPPNNKRLAFPHFRSAK